MRIKSIEQGEGIRDIAREKKTNIENNLKQINIEKGKDQQSETTKQSSPDSGMENGLKNNLSDDKIVGEENIILPVDENGFKILTREIVNTLRSKGMTFDAMGKKFNVNKSVPYKLANFDKYHMESIKIGNKTRLNEREGFPFWEYTDIDLYPMVNKAAGIIGGRYKVNREEIKDFLLDYILSREMHNSFARFLREKKAPEFIQEVLINAAKSHIYQRSNLKTQEISTDLKGFDIEE